MKIFQASKSLAALTKQFTAAGLNIDDFINATDETALQAHIESIKAPAAAVVDPAKVAADAAKPYVTALTKFGANVAVVKEGQTLEGNVEAALDERASIKAADQLAKHGITAALPVAPVVDAAKPAAIDAKLTGLARVTAAIKAEAAAKAAAQA